MHFIHVEQLLDQEGYTILEKIDSGAYGDVFKCINKYSNKEVAVKVISTDDFDKDLKEPNYLQKLDHPNIIKVYNVITCQQLGKIIIEMELINNGTLLNFIKKRNFIPENTIIEILEQSCQALNYLKEKEILHRDINLKNILIKNLDNFQIVFIDFGFVKSTNSLSKTKSFIGTLGYLAPEISEKNYEYSEKSDIFSLGVTLYRLMSYDLQCDIAQYYYILKYDTNKVKEELTRNIKEHYNYYSNNLIQLILKLLEYNAEDRYSANEILKELKNINLTISNDILNINLCNDHLDNLNDFNNEISYNISYETEIIDKKIIDKKIIDIKIDEEELNEEELGIPAC
ncbi:hypothetical protein ABK040_003845 [Willaertia magna]